MRPSTSTSLLVAVSLVALGLAAQRLRRDTSGAVGADSASPVLRADRVHAEDVGHGADPPRRAVAAPSSPSPTARRPAKRNFEDLAPHFERPPKALLTTPAYASRTTQLGERVEALSPTVVEMSLRQLNVPEDRIHEIQKLDLDFHRDLIALWNPPPKTDADVSHVHRQVRELRQALDLKCISLLGVDLANHYNALYSKNLTTMLNASPDTYGPPH